MARGRHEPLLLTAPCANAAVVDVVDVAKRQQPLLPGSKANANSNNPTMMVFKPSQHRRFRRMDSGIDRLSSRYPLQTAGSIFVYWLFVSLIPIYNKYFFSKELFPYPIATAGIQLGVVALILGSWNALDFGWCRRRNPQEDTSSSQQQQLSWIGGPHLLWKMQWCAPIGILFGIKYGVTNLGLHLVPAPTHLLLQATDLVWTVLSAYAINRERVTVIEGICLLGCIAGSVVLSWRQLHPEHKEAEDDDTDAVIDDTDPAAPGWFAILINLFSPMLLGLCIATLRLACCELMRPDNRVRGSVTAVELTTIKLCFSSVVAIVLATIFERGDAIGADGQVNHHHYENPTAHDSWWHAFGQLPVSVKAGVTGGAILIAVFQVNCTFLTKLTSAVSVGLVGQVKIIPQWLVAALFASLTSDFTIQGPNLLGALLIMASAGVFAGSKLYTLQTTTEEPTLGVPKDENDNDIVKGDEEDALLKQPKPSGALEHDGSTAEDTGDSLAVADETTQLLSKDFRVSTLLAHGERTPPPTPTHEQQQQHHHDATLLSEYLSLSQNLH